MHRKKFIQILTAIPLVNIPFKSLAKSYSTDDCKTQKDAEGPFYKTDAPSRSVIETEGQPLRITGQILKGDDCKTPVPNAILDIWHCDNHGEYDMKGYK